MMTMVTMNICTVQTTDAKGSCRISHWRGISAFLGRAVSLLRSRLYSGSKDRRSRSRDNIGVLPHHVRCIDWTADNCLSSRWFS